MHSSHWIRWKFPMLLAGLAHKHLLHMISFLPLLADWMLNSDFRNFFFSFLFFFFVKKSASVTLRQCARTVISSWVLQPLIPGDGEGVPDGGSETVNVMVMKTSVLRPDA